ncbi:MAG: type II toxin-antitoxin system VapC family toxin [Alphaproteobacteria bacterium]|nr:type II toxin-antitoxin system VapC family toxin [Alphaproteobacteria bacterium]
MSFLIDTNIVSEVRKGARCNTNVASWYASIDDGDLYLSVPVLGEIRKGIELVRGRDPAKAEVLEAWAREVDTAFGDRILPINSAAADEWGRMSALRPIPVIDGLLAATAKVQQMTLITRNDADVAGLGAKVLNPFEEAGHVP